MTTSITFASLAEQLAQVQAMLESVKAAQVAPAQSIWTADQTVRYVDRGGRARNDRAATISDGAYDPHGLLAVAARYPGRPIFPEGFAFKSKKDLPGDAVIVRPDGTVRSPQAADTARRAAPPAPRTQTVTVVPAARPEADVALGDLVLGQAMRDWTTRNPHAAAELAQLLASGVGREHTYRDILALGGLVPPRAKKA